MPTLPLPLAGTDAGPSAPRRWVEPALIVGFWTVMAGLSAIGHMLDTRAGWLEPVLPAAPVGLAFANSYLWAALTPLVFRLCRRYDLAPARWRARLAGLLVAGIAVAVAMEMVVAFLRIEVLYESRDRLLAFDPLIGMRRLYWLDDLIVYLAVLAAGFARDYFRRLQHRHDEAVRLQAEAARLQAEAARLEAQLAAARLAALRAQLDPHFLFNTLNAISSLVGSDPRGVRRMIARLSTLLRHTLEESTSPEVPLAQERQVLSQYVDIMEVRFEGRLQVETRLDPDVIDALVPSLILQPLVENAIKHGVSRLPGAAVGRIEVVGRRDGDLVVLTVRDNGPPLDDLEAMARPGGVGVRNTRERLARLYGEAYTLTFTAVPGGGVVAELTLPYHTSADLRATSMETEPTDAAHTPPVAAGGGGTRA